MVRSFIDRLTMAVLVMCALFLVYGVAESFAADDPWTDEALTAYGLNAPASLDSTRIVDVTRRFDWFAIGHPVSIETKAYRSQNVTRNASGKWVGTQTGVDMARGVHDTQRVNGTGIAVIRMVFQGWAYTGYTGTNAWLTASQQQSAAVMDNGGTTLKSVAYAGTQVATVGYPMATWGGPFQNYASVTGAHLIKAHAYAIVYAAYTENGITKYRYRMMLAGKSPNFTSAVPPQSYETTGTSSNGVKLTDWMGVGSGLFEFRTNASNEWVPANLDADGKVTQSWETVGYAVKTTDLATVRALVDGTLVPDLPVQQFLDDQQNKDPRYTIPAETIDDAIKDSPIGGLLPNWARDWMVWLTDRLSGLVTPLIDKFLWFITALGGLEG